MANATPSSGTLTMSAIEGAFPSTVGTYSLSSYRGKTWYTPGAITTGTFSSGQIAFSCFYNKIETNPVQPGSATYTNSGCYGCKVVPLYRNYFQIELWGAGGGGGAGWHDGYKNGGCGQSSAAFGVNAGGGGGGYGGYRYGNQSGGGGGPGTVSGTPSLNGKLCTSTQGTAGGGGCAGGGRGGNGGKGANGGCGGAYSAGFSTNASPGKAPGGGGGGGGASDFKSKCPNQAAGGGGGGGAYAKIKWSPGLTGTYYGFHVGAGGSGTSGACANGGPGANGQIKITWC